MVTSHTCMVILVARGVSCTLHDSTRKDSAVYKWFSLDFIPGSFYFVDFASDSFTVINYGHKYDYMWNPLSPPRESLSWGVVFGNLSTQVVTV